MARNGFLHIERRQTQINQVRRRFTVKLTTDMQSKTYKNIMAHKTKQV